MHAIPRTASVAAAALLLFVHPPGGATLAQAQVDSLNWIVSVRWTAPGDDGMTGRAAEYDVRYSLNPITAGNFNSAQSAAGEIAPSPAWATDSFSIEGLLPDTPYYVAVKTRDEAFNWSPISNVITQRSTIRLGTGVGDDGSFLPTHPLLKANYPNPFNPSTSIEFDLPRSMRVNLEVINSLGQHVTSLLRDRVIPAGSHTVLWDGRTHRGQQAASGVYFYRLRADDRTLVRSMTLLK